MAERTAHNGFVVGSNPAKPNNILILNFKMQFKLKNQKIKSLKTFIKKTPVFFIYNDSSLDLKNQLKLNQTFFINKLNYFKVHNATAKKVFKNSIFKHLKIIINGPITFVTFKSKLLNENTFLTMKNLHSSMTLIGIKLNKKIYSTNQLKRISSLNYKKNIKIFNKSITNFLKLPNKKLNNNSK